jgi:hypothetical protein
MSREIRKVPANWQHPKVKGRYVPMLNLTLSEAMDQVDWSELEDLDPDNEEDVHLFIGAQPDPDNCRPDWPASERTHYQMYEITSEGTPISPVMATPEALASWLVEHRKTLWSDRVGTYDEWLAICNGEELLLAIV